MKSEDISLHAGGLKRCVGGLGFFFSILLFNFVLFSNYYKSTSLQAHYHD